MPPDRSITFREPAIDPERKLIKSDDGREFSIVHMLDDYAGRDVEDIHEAGILIIKCAEDDWRTLDMRGGELVSVN